MGDKSSNQDDSYNGFMLEVVDSKLDLILEAHAALADVPTHLSRLEDDMTVVKADVKTIKHALKDTSQQLNQQDSRITVLEAAG